MTIDKNDGAFIADEGKYWYNEKERAFGKKLRLGKEANPKDWVEITGEEKQRIEIEQEEQKYEEI